MRTTDFILTTSLALALAGCARSVVGITSNGSVPAFTISTFQQAAPSSWLVNSSGSLCTREHQLQITGVCARGVASIKAYDASGNPIGTAATCDLNKQFTWLASYPLNGEYSLSFAAVDSNGATLGSVVSKNIVINSVAPPAPQLLVPSTANYVSSVPRILLQGTVSTNAYSLQVNGATLPGFTAQSGNFDYSVDLNSGETMTVAITATDFFGNISAETTVQIAYLPNLTLAANTLSALGTAPRVGTNVVLQTLTAPTIFARATSLNGQLALKTSIVDMAVGTEAP